MLEDKKKPGTKSRSKKVTGKSMLNPKTCVFTNAKGEKRKLSAAECTEMKRAKKAQFAAESGRAQSGTKTKYDEMKKSMGMK